MTDFKYVGSELDLFAAVVNWKTYWSQIIRPFIRGDVLEAGAGIGSNTPFLDRTDIRRWVCLEPDPALLSARLAQSATRRRYETVTATLEQLDPLQKFDTIVYIDVLEHLENDREALSLAAARLMPGGRIVVLSPAHQELFTPFDEAIGHFRRYNKQMIRDISPDGLRLERLMYLDTVGLLASLANRLLLRQSMPTKDQLQLWDRWMIPTSRVIDKILAYSIGKSIIAVWQRENGWLR